MASYLETPGVPRIGSVRDLSQIKDLETAFLVMMDLNINPDDVYDMTTALDKIKRNFNKEEAKQIYHEQDRVLKEAVTADCDNRQQLKVMFEQSRSYLQSLPSQFQKDLQHVFPNVLPTFDAKIQQLQTNDCIIVVAGEKGAGKSSLVNLIAGCKILPADLINGTRTICELRHSEKRMFVLHSWDERIEPCVKECRNGNDSSLFLKELTYHVTVVDQTTQKSPYMKIEIYWPLPILGEGVVIVDSPGVAESRKVSQQLEYYMARAFGFIYVINISNAGGIHRDRFLEISWNKGLVGLQAIFCSGLDVYYKFECLRTMKPNGKELGQLLCKAVERSEQGFDPSTALFVCNWWDQVAPDQEEYVLQETLARLSRVWPGVRRQQLFPLSSTRSLSAAENGIVVGEYKDLVNGLRAVLPTTFNVKLSSYYRWLSAVLKRSLYSLKISSNIGRKQMAEKEAAFHNIRNQIEALESDAGSQIDVMRAGFRREVDNITRKLLAFLKSESCLKEMAVWSPGDCPAPDKDVKKVGKEAASKFSDRLASVIDSWEIQNGLVSKVKSNILKTFQRDLDLFEDQIKRLEGVLFEGMDNRIITDLHHSMRHQMPVKSVWKKARKEKGGTSADMGCFSLGSAISGCRTQDLKAAPLKNILKSSLGPPGMKDVTLIFLQQFKEEEIASAVKKFFDRIAKRFDAASRLLPEFLKADRNLMQTLQGEVKGEQERLASMFPKLMSVCTKLQGQLDMFFVTRLMFFDFRMKELKYDAGKPIGRGSFADVFSSTLENGDTVALKIQRDKLNAKNVTDVLLEDRTLREIRHENIIRYYGAARERQGNDLRWVMVLEYCTRTIKHRFLSEEANVPGRQKIVSLHADAMREVAHFASQICGALCYLHNKGIVHRDLKPDNILLTQDDVVKLTDVGLAKQAIDIAGTLAGTPVYMAPEILLQKGQYDMKVDVYSLAIILWELWYGQDAADHIGSHLFGRLEDAVKAGLRPSLTMTIKPPDDWISLFQSGWEFEASKRPTSREMAEFFDTFLRKCKS